MQHRLLSSRCCNLLSALIFGHLSRSACFSSSRLLLRTAGTPRNALDLRCSARNFATLPGMETLAKLGECASHSWLEQLEADPETELHAPNRKSREVKSGHYVRVLPTPLPDPKLIIHSEDMSKHLGLSEEVVQSDQFVRFFSGEQSLVPELESWCTPYALSIMGNRYTHNCPFGTGNGYGDGRAISIGEVVVNGERWELQMKGSGTTPFCRGGDGRAVLRSSIREFLASEAMFHLRVPTTRALCLIKSETEKARRPWYSGEDRMPSEDHPRLASLPAHERKMYMREIALKLAEPDVMIRESCAITTRVSPSFLRVGHLDLFARRAEVAPTPDGLRQLEQLISHALFREYPDVSPDAPLPARAKEMLRAAADRFGRLVADWLRVGFCQGNFNADNCLVGGRTMDYGPFGFIDCYDPLFAKWVGSGDHYAFMNQPNAILANLQFAVSLSPVLSGGLDDVREVLTYAKRSVLSSVQDVWRRKFGLRQQNDELAQDLFNTYEDLLRRSCGDWTIIWRQLAEVVLVEDGAEDEKLLAPLLAGFYEPLTDELKESWIKFLKRWRNELANEGTTAQQAAEQIRSESPMFIPREWMLVEAYKQAEKEDFSLVQEAVSSYSTCSMCWGAAGDCREDVGREEL
ncbi:hypothetical protein GUITHDRAFT_95515 [Guillardia theta CCMP2712]|uniref:Selenoprotein O n=1 Tax=Guillardia theta (strain CCMP2712) TaxID=905079 RepID=L1J3R7_GUITC|nr:hypothetical protein GUITHDRAFT_95515 [Guillardia theta CCMP2712]EKX42962.1 hypothetical protein GUITHDRAFT_95515 [Guillardia theta CCMP2712]|eukprot:XP_005829942.1 hypothetical protein GUITHDRAFT_95515 [Guillardia theta CCMP2712]